jgi:predicted Zn-dependent protease
MAARCRRHLDRALEHARKAVALAPAEPGYLDTLAEVQFQRGEKDRAIENMKKCLALSPKSDYFRKQLERFERGDPSAEVPDAGD